jgi:hypothetical protein
VKLIKSYAIFISIGALAASLISIASASAALDCSKAPDSKTPACVIANQSKNVAEEVDPSAALAQKAAALAARKAAEAKASKSPVVVTTPIATISAIAKPTSTNAAATPAPAVTPSSTPAAVVPVVEPKVSATPAASVQSQAPAQPIPSVSKSSVKTPSTVSKPKTNGKKKITISCKKGAKVIKVTSLSPSCPTGFRRK